MIMKIKEDNGYVTIVALILLIGLTIIGMSASTTSNTDILVARNLVPFKQDFYMAEGGQNKEAIKIARGDYPVLDTSVSGVQLAESTDEILPGDSYDYTIKYEGVHTPPSGYSALHYTRYDYSVTTKGGDSGVTIDSRYYSIGPRAE